VRQARCASPAQLNPTLRLATADQLALAFNEHFDGLADHRPVIGRRCFLLNREQIIVTATLHVFGNVIGVPIDRDGPRSRGVFEDEAVLKAAVFDELNRGGEIFIGFGRESHNEIAGQAISGM